MNRAAKLNMSINEPLNVRYRRGPALSDFRRKIENDLGCHTQVHLVAGDTFPDRKFTLTAFPLTEIQLTHFLLLNDCAEYDLKFISLEWSNLEP